MEYKSLLLVGVCSVDDGSPDLRLPSTGFETGETTLGDWPFLIFFSTVLGVLILMAGFSFNGIPSSPASNVTKEQYPSVEEIARNDPSLDLAYFMGEK